jgi:hypothetical protein
LVIGKGIKDLIKKVLLILFLVSISFGQDNDSLNVRTPRKAALWSILPGGGQIYNKKYLKAGIIITLESLALWQSIENGSKYKDEPTDELLTNRNRFAWWALLVHIYGTLDAVVDSHLKPFNEVMTNESFEEDKIIIEESTPDGK